MSKRRLPHDSVMRALRELYEAFNEFGEAVQWTSAFDDIAEEYPNPITRVRKANERASEIFQYERERKASQ